MEGNIYGLDEKFFEKPIEEINPWDEFAIALKRDRDKAEEEDKKDGKTVETQADVVTEDRPAKGETIVYETKIPAQKKGGGRKKIVKSVKPDNSESVSGEEVPDRVVSFKVTLREYLLLKSFSIATGKTTSEMLRWLINDLPALYPDENKVVSSITVPSVK